MADSRALYNSDKPNVEDDEELEQDDEQDFFQESIDGLTITKLHWCAKKDKAEMILTEDASNYSIIMLLLYHHFIVPFHLLLDIRVSSIEL